MFPDPDISLTPVLEDLEIVAGFVRILRAGQHRTARKVMKAAQDLYPSEPIDRLRRCAVHAAEAMSVTASS